MHSGGEGQGSEFVVRLPLDKSQRAVTEDCGTEVKSSNLAGLHVLLVEDHADIRFVTSRLLMAVGCDVTQAENGSRGIDAIARHRPDVALIDIGLPDMNGYDVARRIRDLPEGRNVKLLAVTGFGQPEDRQKALDAGFDDHLIKPLEYQALVSVIRATFNDDGDGDGNP